MRSFKYILLIMFFAAFSAQAEEEQLEIGIEEQLGKTIPMDLEFTDSDGNKKKLKEIVTKPTILSLVYYHCPGICSPLLTGLSDVVDKVDLQPGKDFQVLTISFDHTEDYTVANKWKKNYMASVERPIKDEDWIFMTGDSASIKQLTNSVGFYFKPEGEDFIHTGTLISLSPKGKISRYLFGTEYNPFDLKMAIIEAEKGKSNPTINKMIAYCFSYDPEGKKYVFNATRVAGTAVLLGAGIFLTVLIIKGRSKKNKNS